MVDQPAFCPPTPGAPVRDSSSPDPEGLSFNDWDIPLRLLRELYLKPEYMSYGLSTIPSSGSSTTLGTPTFPPSSSAQSILHAAAVSPGSSAPTPNTPPTVVFRRVRTDSGASNASSAFVGPSSEQGGIRRSASLSHAATPRHATASRRWAPGGSICKASGIINAVGATIASDQLSQALSPSGADVPHSSSSASLSSLGQSFSAKPRTRVVSFSPSQMPQFLPTRVLSFEQKKRVLVTGGAGFVGSHLVDRLMLMGHEVMVVDNFFTGTKSSLSHWVGHPSFELVRHDVVNPLLVEVDQIYHLACPASPKSYQVNQIKTIKTNFMGTMNMLGLAKRTKARFLLASTSEVYGDPDVHPQPENYNGNVNQTGPRGCYDEGKRIAETLTYGYLYQDGVDVRVARIFNTYGPRMHPFDGRVVSNFILQGLKGEPLTVYGDGSQTRSFMFIHDLVDALIALMNVEVDDIAGSDPTDEKGRDDLLHGVHGPVNIGNGHEFTIKELVEAVAAAVQQVKSELSPNGLLEMGSLSESLAAADAPHVEGEAEEINGVKVVYCPMPTDDPKQRRPDTTRAKQLLNWEPRWSLKEGLLEMCRYYAHRMESGEVNV
ncbi:NAD(P)-binding protein, partial [Tilletiaria anomala UBC 951]